MNIEISVNNTIDKEDESSSEGSLDEYLSEYSSDEFSNEVTNELNDDVVNEDPLKKKRGRKCKPKEENVEVEKIQKKRGRKPKIKDLEEIEKIPKKRGRKPKEKVYSVKELPKTFFEENKNETLILHLPIKTMDIINENIPLPNNNNDLYSIYNDVDNYKINDNNLLLTQDNLLNENNTKQESHVDNNEFQNKEDENKINKVIKKNLKNIMYEFINANNDKIWPESTNIYCWWCCHPFTCTPCALPEYYKKEKFYVNGCFCSFNCTASYNFSKNDDNIWERYSLLNLMYKKLYSTNFVKINLAPPRETLKIFGGYMSIEEFRENSLKNDKIFTVVSPPLISIIPKIEENIANNTNNMSNTKNLKNNFPLINENILNKTQNNLKFKRNKPITNPNSTLQSFMDLKII